MVLLGLGILFASLTFFLLRDPRSRWRETVEKWMWTTGGVVDKVSAQQKEKNDRFDSGTPRLEGSQGILRVSPISQPQAEKARHGHELQKVLPPPTTNTGLLGTSTQASTPSFVIYNEHAIGQDKDIELQSWNHSPGHSLSAPSSRKLSNPSSNERPPAPKSNTTTSKPIPKIPRVSASQLMPPPSARPSALRPLPRLGNSLNPPPSLASTLRGPASGSLTSGSTSSLVATSSTLAPSARPSRKVILPPGHSPLDWAQLTSHPPSPTFLRGADVPPQLIRVTPSQLREKNGRKDRDAWSTWQGKVYNVTPYKKFHPGGEGELMRGAGKPGEAERLFMEIHPWVNWESMLGECMVGILVGDNEYAEEETDLESMD
ncbi:hypothetical protein MMC18_003860 [Xylographa bjoerkii]|nr:hypothetical protein [Xylographa bjoerkii]